MKIDSIYIATHRFDLEFTRACVASIRLWYPDIPIWLLKDRYNGDFSTRELERLWGVREFVTARRRFGWGMSKLEPFFQPGSERFLVIDSDIVFVGPLLRRLERFNEDLVVHEEHQPAEKVAALYFNLEKLRRTDPDFDHAGVTFNTGQFVGRAGAFGREDFIPFLDASDPPRVRQPEVFKNGDQGLLNYVAIKKWRACRLTLRREPFMWWSAEEMGRVDLQLMQTASPYEQLIHWAGLRRDHFAQMPRGDILEFFERRHYERVPLGGVRCRARKWIARWGSRWLHLRRHRLRFQ